MNMKSINKIAALLMTAAAIFAVNSCDSNGSGTEGSSGANAEGHKG